MLHSLLFFFAPHITMGKRFLQTTRLTQLEKHKNTIRITALNAEKWLECARENKEHESDASTKPQKLSNRIE